MESQLRHGSIRRMERWIVGLIGSLAIATACAAAGACADAFAAGPVTSATVDPVLLSTAAADPLGTLQVVVRARDADSAAAAVTAVAGTIRRRLAIVDGVAATVPASALQTLAAAAHVESVSLD